MSDKNKVKLIQIYDVALGESCTNCPNINNRPENDGCGLEVCLDTIVALTKELIDK